MTTTAPATACPAWCVAHDPAPEAPAQDSPLLHLSREVHAGYRRPYAYRWDRSDAPTFVSVDLPDRDMTPREALQIAAQLIDAATAALEDVPQ
jgi:hypothetical protein